ncbi:hypothetical protein [Microvirga zambiensis]|uniref:hypothetical protein n=1 Tax=Microvirga zambiensis TaxID=1402137 RepID=UPI00191CE6A4|nr:hypothetical protein [Microvirga zambiensis]
MAQLQILTSDEHPEDRDNNITLTEVVRSGDEIEYMVTVLIDGTAIAVSGPFASRDEAVAQANGQSAHYELEPIYFRRDNT